MTSFFDQVLTLAKAKAPELISSAVAANFEADREPEIRVTAPERARAGALVRALRKAAVTGQWVNLRKPIGRGGLIWAATSLCENDDVEWAVVGLGTGSDGGRSFIRQVYARRGRQGSVSLPVSLLAEIRGHLEAVEGGELVHIHNHPMNAGRLLKNALFGEDPMASWADRRFHLEYELFRQDVNRKAIRPRQVRCYLIENGDVKRYNLAAAPELAIKWFHEAKALGLVQQDTAADVLRVLSDIGFRADPALVERLLRR